MSADITPYTDLVTSEHADKPKFMASLAAVLQPIADLIATQCGMPAAFDVEFAAGVQLDVDGAWAGASRHLPILANTYFSWNVAKLGWNQANWKGPFDPAEGLTTLDDTNYRNFIFATVLANQWDGSIPELYNILYTLIGEGGGVFAGLIDAQNSQILDAFGNPIGLGGATNFLIQDNGDMSFYIALGDVPAVPAAIIEGGFLHIKPAGVRLNVIEASVITTPPTALFGFGVQNAQIKGWGSGAWAQILATE
jgi:Protein of unknown function (DUF2612)